MDSHVAPSIANRCLPCNPKHCYHYRPFHPPRKTSPIGSLGVIRFPTPHSKRLTVLAEEKTTSEKAVRKEVTLQEIAATGKLAKLTTDYTVTEANGTVIKVTAPKVVKGEQASVVDLDKFEKLVGRDVKVIGMGTAKTSKAGKKISTIKTVTRIEETIDSTAAPAVATPSPAAPVAAPKAK